MSKAGNSLLRTTLIRAADWARKQDPQLARIYYVQMTERGKTHLAANCVVAAHLAERAWLVMRRGTPYVLRDIDGTAGHPRRGQGHHRRALQRHRRDPQTPTEQQRGEGPSKSSHGTFEVTRQGRGQNEATFPRPPLQPDRRQESSEPLDRGSPIGNQTEPFADRRCRSAERSHRDITQPFTTRGNACSLSVIPLGSLALPLATSVRTCSAFPTRVTFLPWWSTQRSTPRSDMNCRSPAASEGPISPFSRGLLLVHDLVFDGSYRAWFHIVSSDVPVAAR